MIHWLRHHTSTAGSMGSSPGQGTKIPCVAKGGQINNFFKLNTKIFKASIILKVNTIK